MLTSSQKLDALSWKLAPSGVSYGEYIQTLDEQEVLDIYREYEEELIRRKIEEQQRINENRQRKLSQKKKQERNAWENSVFGRNR